MRNRLPGAVKIGFRLRPQFVGYQLRQVYADGRGGGQAGRIDTGTVEKAGRVFGLSQDEIPVCLTGAQPGKGGDGQFGGQGRHAAPALFHDFIQSICRGVDRFSVRQVFRGRAHHQVAVDGRRDQNSLPHGAGKLKNGMGDQIPRFFVQELIFSPTGGNGQLVCADHVVENVRVDARRVDDAAGFKDFSAGSSNLPAQSGLALCIRFPGRKRGNLGYRCVKTEADAVLTGVFRQRDGH